MYKTNQYEMDNTMNNLYGMNIYSTVLAVEDGGPNKVQVKTRSMSENYHKRIQKKWNKRDGLKQVPCIFKTPQGIVAHPLLIAEIQKHIGV
jgi:hypothetical protein